VRHSEQNASKSGAVHFLQIWILPAKTGTAPSYEQTAFSEADKRGKLRLVGSPDGAEGSVTIHADARLYATVLERGEKVEHAVRAGRHAWIHVATGSVRVGDVTLHAGDGASTSDASVLSFEGVERAEVLLFDLG
jgi:redox-sensitive bicupin YhaK (pirin superfamily)